MLILLNLLLIIIGIYSLIIVAYSKSRHLSLECSCKEVKNLIKKAVNPICPDKVNNIPDFVNKVWTILNTVDGEVFSKIKELNETGTQVCNVEDKGDSIYEIKWLFPCLNEQKAEVEALIRGIASDYGFIVINCSWEQVMGRLEAICVKVDISGGNSEVAKQLLLNKRRRLIASLEPPEEDYDDEL
jgi:hypothetical protein